ncbi:hypothetical protein ACWGR4_30280 [Embleya sp. NPDC055664]
MNMPPDGRMSGWMYLRGDDPTPGADAGPISLSIRLRRNLRMLGIGCAWVGGGILGGVAATYLLIISGASRESQASAASLGAMAATLGLLILCLLPINVLLDTFDHFVDRSVVSARIARGYVALVASLAGRQRLHLADEWNAHLNSGEQPLTGRDTLRACAGFLAAALRMRTADLAGHLWRPVDWFLRTEGRSRAFVSAAVGAFSIFLVHRSGTAQFVAQEWLASATLGTVLLTLVRWLRRIRCIEVRAAESGAHKTE